MSLEIVNTVIKPKTFVEIRLLVNKNLKSKASTDCEDCNNYELKIINPALRG